VTAAVSLVSGGSRGLGLAIVDGLLARGDRVAAEIVLADPLPDAATPDHVRTAALAMCRESLEAHSVPRVLDIVKQIATTAAGKTPRRPL
jgi:NAD(P)-dependent dehydrogenase (short-subunit alcohol dehydrogenase family)